MTNPNRDPWVRELLERRDEDPDEEALDPNVPDGWREEPGFLAASRLGPTEDVNSRLAQYEGAEIQRAEHRIVNVNGIPADYIVIFTRKTEADEAG